MPPGLHVLLGDARIEFVYFAVDWTYVVHLAYHVITLI
jgi:hypothetical protein